MPTLLTAAAHVVAFSPSNALDARYLATTLGLVGIIVILYAETGLLLGFFLPGDSLLFTAGFLASLPLSNVAHLNLAAVLIGSAAAAIAGAETGYLIGRRAGPVLFARPDSRLFKREYVGKAQHYLDRFGTGRAVVLARFIPVVRTFLNPLAGVVGMPTRTFTLWNVVGGLLWTVGVTMLGYGLGSTVPGVDKYLLPAIAVIVVVSLIPVVLEIVKARRERADAADPGGAGPR